MEDMLQYTAMLSYDWKTYESLGCLEDLKAIIPLRQ